MFKKWETIYLLSPIIVISLKAIDLSNRGWNVVTPSDRMLSIILAEGEHLVFATRHSLSARYLVCPHTGGVANAPPPVTQIVTFGDAASSQKIKY